ncbi:hypothetical protein MA9V1_177 [Chryseobacterium phage MA9V-1]|nr:hypothetical protein MA9V1_177 [Chryseobacterium phage MA9V-1]
MKKYVVATMNFFDNKIIQKVVEAESDIEAAKKFRASQYNNDEDNANELEFQQSPDYPKTVEELDQYLFNGDELISVIEIE